MPFFDHYSWQVFIALVWPALSGADHRGSADLAARLETVNPEKKLNGLQGVPDLPTVFESYKPDWETFSGEDKPSAWDKPNIRLPCPDATADDFVLKEIRKRGDVIGPQLRMEHSVLVAQNGKFVWYLAAYNKDEFDKIRNNDLFIQENALKQLKDHVIFEPGALSVKSSWIEMTDIPHPERFHTRKAWLLDDPLGDPSFKANCRQITVGLVGLHIVQKTPQRQQWIWTTFEHVDNVPPPGYVPPALGQPHQTFTFNNGTDMPAQRTLPAEYLYEKLNGAPSRCPAGRTGQGNAPRGRHHRQRTLPAAAAARRFAFSSGA